MIEQGNDRIQRKRGPAGAINYSGTTAARRYREQHGLQGKHGDVFNISQTDGEPLPDLETESTGDPGKLVEVLLESGDSLWVETRIVPPEEWNYGEAKGIRKQWCLMTMRPRVEVKDRKNQTDLAGTVIHKLAHTLLHFDIEDDTEHLKREVEGCQLRRGASRTQGARSSSQGGVGRRGGQGTIRQSSGRRSKATITIKEINDNHYYYWQWQDGEKIMSKYKAPVNPDE